MQSSKHLAAALLCAAPCLLSQTLHKRPPEQPKPAPAHAEPILQSPPTGLTLQQGTSLQVEIPRNYAMKAGETIEGHLVYPLYVEGHLAVPAGATVRGTVVELAPDTKMRWRGRLRGDLTPFHIARVEFNELTIDGVSVPLHTSGAVTGAPVLRLVAPGAKPHQSFVGREWSMAKSRAHQQLAFFTDPGLGGRALDVAYHQLPYHPERIPAHTAWTFELSSPVSLPNPPAVAANSDPAPLPGQPEVWNVRALLTAHLTSATAKPGDAVEALVVEPVYDKDHQLVVPQGSTLIGRVTTAKSARSLGRNGKLRFTFQQVRFPQGTNQDSANRPVQGALSGATAEGNTGLSMDAEGTVTPKSKASALAPLLLTMLAGRALDNDGNMTVQTGVASNGFGLVGRIVGVAAGNRNFAAGIGFYAAALSTYENFLSPGHDVDFPKDTRIEIATTPLRAPILQPETH